MKRHNANMHDDQQLRKRIRSALDKFYMAQESKAEIIDLWKKGQKSFFHRFRDWCEREIEISLPITVTSCLVVVLIIGGMIFETDLTKNVEQIKKPKVSVNVVEYKGKEVNHVRETEQYLLWMDHECLQ